MEGQLQKGEGLSTSGTLSCPGVKYRTTWHSHSTSSYSLYHSLHILYTTFPRVLSRQVQALGLSLHVSTNTHLVYVLTLIQPKTLQNPATPLAADGDKPARSGSAMARDVNA